MENNGKGLLAQVRDKEMEYTSSPLTLESFTQILKDISKQSAKQTRFRYPGSLLVACSDKDFKAFYKRKNIEWGPVGSEHYKIIQDRIKKLIDGE